MKMLVAVQTLFFFIYELIGYLSTVWILTLILGYILIVIFYWNPKSSPILKALAVPVWIALLLQVITLAGPFKVPLFIALVTMLVVGFVSEVKEAGERTLESPDADVAPAVPWWVRLYGASFSPDAGTSEQERTIREEGTQGVDDVKEAETKPESKPKPTRETTNKTPAHKTSGRSLSNLCFIGLFWALVLARIWVNFWVVSLIPALFLFLIIKRVLYQFGGFAVLHEKVGDNLEKGRAWLDQRRDAFSPSPIKRMAKMVVDGDRKIVGYLEESLDKLMSIVIILALIIGTTIAAMFVCVQVHHETVHLLTVTSNLANSSLHPELSNWMPKGDDLQKAVDSMAENAYVHGREYIGSKLKKLLSGDNTDKDVSKLEQHALEVWDKMYQSWINRNQSVPSSLTSRDSSALTNWSSLWESMTKLDGFNYDSTILFVQDNLGTFVAALESVWLVLKSNINLALNVVTAVISLLFGGGTAILNFVLAVVVFVTTLFYLLASSGDRYKPVDWMMSMVPSGESSSANSFGNAVEVAISGVFMASFKMAAFYGLYTWLTHTVFDINIVFIPSALAALFGAIPFLGTYWAALPAVIELWIVQGNSIKALLLLLCHFLPMCFVDTAIYSDIKGGSHPYLTGLAIAGGLYWMGLEGAIIGPILLCSLIVAFNVYGSMLKPEDAKTKPRVGLKEDRRVTFNLQRQLSCPSTADL